MKTWIQKIKNMGACGDAVEWCEQFETSNEAWLSCERGDWMLWLLGKLSGKSASDSRRKLVLVACQCVRLALPYVKKGEARPLKAIEITESWARKEGGTLVDVKKAAYADAAYVAYYAAAAYAAYAACAAAVAYAAAAYAAYAACAAATRKSTLKRCADIVREYYPEPPSLKGVGN